MKNQIVETRTIKIPVRGSDMIAFRINHYLVEDLGTISACIGSFSRDFGDEFEQLRQQYCIQYLDVLDVIDQVRK